MSEQTEETFTESAGDQEVVLTIDHRGDEDLPEEFRLSLQAEMRNDLALLRARDAGPRGTLAKALRRGYARVRSQLPGEFLQSPPREARGRDLLRHFATVPYDSEEFDERRASQIQSIPEEMEATAQPGDVTAFFEPAYRGAAGMYNLHPWKQINIPQFDIDGEHSRGKTQARPLPFYQDEKSKVWLWNVYKYTPTFPIITLYAPFILKGTSYRRPHFPKEKLRNTIRVEFLVFHGDTLLARQWRDISEEGAFESIEWFQRWFFVPPGDSVRIFTRVYLYSYARGGLITGPGLLYPFSINDFYDIKSDYHVEMPLLLVWELFP